MRERRAEVTRRIDRPRHESGRPARTLLAGLCALACASGSAAPPASPASPAPADACARWRTSTDVEQAIAVSADVVDPLIVRGSDASCVRALALEIQAWASALCADPGERSAADLYGALQTRAGSLCAAPQVLPPG